MDMACSVRLMRGSGCRIGLRTCPNVSDVDSTPDRTSPIKFAGSAKPRWFQVLRDSPSAIFSA